MSEIAKLERLICEAKATKKLHEDAAAAQQQRIWRLEANIRDIRRRYDAWAKQKAQAACAAC